MLALKCTFAGFALRCKSKPAERDVDPVAAPCGSRTLMCSGGGGADGADERAAEDFHVELGPHGVGEALIAFF